MEEEILGALARGYTYPENSSKVLDNDLINAMAEEVMKVINTIDISRWNLSEDSFIQVNGILFLLRGM